MGFLLLCVIIIIVSEDDNMKTKKLLFVICFLFIFNLSIINVKADDANVYNGYKIDAYDVNIIVEENNTLVITENIKANFTVPKHGIIRKIPLKNEVKREDGSTSRNSIRLTDLDVNAKYKASNSSGNRVIKIGEADKTLTGLVDYKISYKYNLGKDPSKDFDELYYNIIGDEWDTSISNVTFTITMPADFDTSKLGFSSGKYGTKGSNNIEYTIDNNKIVGRYLGVLKPNEAITVRCELQEGYFKNASIPLPITFPLMFIIPTLVLIITAFLWNKHGRDDEVIETVEFYPPNGLNSAEVAFYYKNSVSTNDANSLLIYLANKGYLKITETDTHGSKYTIEKLKDYDGSNESERLFMKGLFASKNLVTKDDLYDKFYKTIEKVKYNIDNTKNRALVYDSKASKMQVYSALLVLLSVVTTVFIPSIDYGTFGDVMGTFIFCLIAFILLAVSLYVNIPIIARIPIAVLIVFIFSIVIIDLPIYYAMEANILMFIAVVFGFVVGLGTCFFVRYMSKRTPFGTEMYGKVKGFRNFLATAEKEKLEALVNENPTYFYNILPFTYVFGLSNKWIKKFESITMQEPEWYESSRPFTVSHLDHFLLSTMSSASDRVVETSSSSGGGFSGGGFSGGGSGGGGGSSW